MAVSVIEPTPFTLYRESEKMLYVPKFYGLSKFGIPERNKLGSGTDAPGLVFQGSLRNEQLEPANKFIAAARNPSKMGGIVSIGCGGGKTVIGLYLASVFKKQTLIVCHKEFLMNQWRERIEQFLPQARIGRIKQKHVEVDSRDIVIASLQSLAMRDYDKSIFAGFGFVIYDECHHNGAEVFSQSMLKMTIPITLGLSATLNRKDGLRKVFEWYLGKPVYEKKKSQDTNLIVKMVKYYDDCPEYSRERLLWNGKRNTPQMMNAICAYKPRNAVILDALAEVLKREPGRKTIILSDRRNHLTELAKEITARKLGSHGFYVGGMKQEDLKKSEAKDIILGTYTLVSEGFDVPSLNTLVFASPISSIEQSVGRIQRQKPEDRLFTPLIIDIWDDFSLYRNQGFTRIKFYKKNGYDIQCDDSTEEPTEPEGSEKVEFIDDDD
jgi:superfamily II DNA or RNA helicase